MSRDADETAGESVTRVVLGEESNEDDRLTGEFVVDVSLGVREKYPARRLPLEEALRWGRSVADMVVIDAGGHRFSAGSVPEPGLEGWVDGTRLRVRRSYEPPGPAVSHFWIAAEGDGSPVQPELVDRLRDDPAIREVRMPTPGSMELSVRQGDEDVADYAADVLSRLSRELLPLSKRGPDAPPYPYSRGFTSWLRGPDRR